VKHNEKKLQDSTETECPPVLCSSLEGKKLLSKIKRERSHNNDPLSITPRAFEKKVSEATVRGIVKEHRREEN